MSLVSLRRTILKSLNFGKMIIVSGSKCTRLVSDWGIDRQIKYFERYCRVLLRVLDLTPILNNQLQTTKYQLDPLSS